MQKHTKHPVPTLNEFLGDGGRFEGFEEWMRALALRERAAEDPTEASALRMLRVLTVACQEAYRRETEQNGQAVADTLLLLARVAGMAVMAPTLDLIDDSRSSDAQDLVQILVGEFSFGAEYVLQEDANARTREEQRSAKDEICAS